MNREKKLVQNTIILTIGKISTQLISFFLLPLYTAVLTTEEYGIVDLLNTCISLIVPVITLQIEHAVFRFLIENREDEENKSVIISTNLIIQIVQTIIYIILFMIIAKNIHNDYKYFLATNVIAAMFSSTMLQISRGLGDNLRYTIGSFITAATTILFNLIFILGLHIGAYGMLLATLLGNCICIIYIFITKKIYKYFKITRYNKQQVKELFKYSIPLIPNAISWWTINTSDKVIVSAILGVAVNGIYSAANKFSSMAITIYNIFNMSWTESVALHINDEDGEEYISKTMNSAFKLFSSMCIGIIACMPFVFNIMINEKFKDAYYQIPILMLSALCNIIIGLVSAIYIARKDTKVIAKTSLMSAIINIIINIGLIKIIGLYAASISTFLSYFTMMILRVQDVKKYMKINIHKYEIIKTVIMILFVFIAYYINNIIINIIVLILAIVYAIHDNWELIKNIIFLCKSKIKRLLNS